MSCKSVTRSRDEKVAKIQQTYLKIVDGDNVTHDDAVSYMSVLFKLNTRIINKALT